MFKFLASLNLQILRIINTPVSVGHAFMMELSQYYVYLHNEDVIKMYYVQDISVTFFLLI